MEKTLSVEVDYGVKSSLFQVAVCLISNTALLPSGMTLGFTAVALPYMLQPNDLFHVDSDQASWIASIAAIITPLGCLTSGPIIDRFGRKTGLLLINIPAFLGWLCIAIKPSLTLIYIGRLLTGFACGFSSTPATVYIAESSTPSLRGYLVTGTSIAISLGVAIVYIMGLFLRENWQLVAGLCSAFPIISMISIICLMPESPAWLIRRGKYKKASESMQFLRGKVSAESVQKELDELIEKLKSSSNKATNFAASIKAFSRPESYKPFILMNTFFLFQQLTGIFVVIFYAVDVVKEAGVKSDPFVIAVLIGLTRLFFTIAAAWMSKSLGRRITALVSGVGMTISLMVLSTHLLMKHTAKYDNTFEHPLENLNLTNTNLSNVTTGILSEDVESPSFIPVITILVYILASTVGFLTLPWAMIGEVYPAQVRGIASGATTCITYIVSFIVVKLYPKMLETLNKHGVFYFYGAMALLGTIFVFFFLPETQGKSLAEIEQHFAKRKKRRTNIEEEENLHNSTKMVVIKNFSNNREGSNKNEPKVQY
uniref:Putative facilitated trehalose transporter tret1-like protein n=1 Tax=Rhodnius neglectus TaxID=72488 RepID=A0A0P4W055_9HEMI